MVRVLHAVFHSLVRDGWSSELNNFAGGSTTVMDQPLHSTINAAAATADDLINSNVSPQHPFICREFYRVHSVGIFYGENPLNYAFSLFLFEIILVILLTRIIRFLLKPLKQPRIVSEIIGGIMIGPSVLGRSKIFTKDVFPDNSQYVIRNIGVMGFMFFLFISGVKMDITLVKRSGKKHLYMAVLGVFVPMIVVGTVGFMLRSSMDKNLATAAGIGGVSSNLSITAFPVIYLILKELNLLSSEVGRMALSSAIIGDLMAIFAILVFEALNQSESSNRAALWYVISSIVLGAFVLTVVRRALIWVVEKTPEGTPVSQDNVVLIFLGVLGMGFLTDMFGVAIANGSLWLGLVLPDGPPLGATVVDRCETIVMELLMPFSFAMVGLTTDVSAMVSYGWSGLWPLLAMVMTGYLLKLVTTMGVALYYRIPWKDGLTLSLIMNLRGQVELVLFIHWIDKRIVGIPNFTMLVLVTLIMTGICTPLISILYDPTKPYMVNKRRTIQHTPLGAELRIVLCIPDKESVASLINLLNISHPTQSAPFSIYGLRLVELVGRCNPLFIDHSLSPKEAAKFSDFDAIENALMRYHNSQSDVVKVQTFTAVTVKRSMYQDVCEIALSEKATLILLPFEARPETMAGTEPVRIHAHSLCADVLSHAPCSVGIFVDKKNSSRRNPIPPGQSFRRSEGHKYVMLFLGGADAREALVYADRMAQNPDVGLMVIRFLAYNNERDDEIEKKLDDGVVTSFWVKNEQNLRIAYREVVVRDGEETLAAIQAFNDEENELWIVGRGQGMNPVLVQGLTGWSENQELGVIGDFVASDFGGPASALIVHQQIMRVQGTDSYVVPRRESRSVLSKWIKQMEKSYY